MSETNGNSTQWRRLTVALAMITTVAASLIAGLQTDADIRTDVANRDSQYYAILTSGELFRQGLQSDYDFATLSAAVKDSQEATLLEFTALEQESRSEAVAASSTRLRASLALARADRLGALSVILTDPTYAPDREGDLPDMEAYLADSFEESNRLLALQNQAADDYDRWNRKSDAYVGILALMAMGLFLFGLAQAANLRTRKAFAVLGASVLGLGLVWTLLSLLA
jgi:hypothetical protein